MEGSMEEKKPRRRREQWVVTPQKSDVGSMKRLKERLETQNRSEVLRVALKFYDRCAGATAVWIEVDGERQRIFIP